MVGRKPLGKQLSARGVQEIRVKVEQTIKFEILM
jgi:hypothetical protein